MRVVHAPRHFRAQLDRLPQRQGLAPNDTVERPAVDQLHAEVAATVAFAHFVDRHDPGMIQAGGRLGFAPETPEVRLCGPRTKTDDLERDNSVQAFLARPVDHALPAASDFFLQFVIAKIAQLPRFRVQPEGVAGHRGEPFFQQTGSASLLRIVRQGRRPALRAVPALRQHCLTIAQDRDQVPQFILHFPRQHHRPADLFPQQLAIAQSQAMKGLLDRVLGLSSSAATPACESWAGSSVRIS